MERQDYLDRPCTLVCEGKTAYYLQTLTDFRGEVHTLTGGDAPHHANSTGKVYTNRGEFYPSVIGCKWVPTALLEARETLRIAKFQERMNDYSVIDLGEYHKIQVLRAQAEVAKLEHE